MVGRILYLPNSANPTQKLRVIRLTLTQPRFNLPLQNAIWRVHAAQVGLECAPN